MTNDGPDYGLTTQTNTYDVRGELIRSVWDTPPSEGPIDPQPETRQYDADGHLIARKGVRFIFCPRSRPI